MDMNYDETARLILMEKPQIPLIEFAPAMKLVHVELKAREGIEIVSDLWKKYRGFDGRSVATHDFTTGLPYRPRNL